jgi:hypothetical protein
LPVELINAIEGDLVEDIHSEFQEQWAASLRCWENRCKAYDYFTPEQRVSAFQNWYYGPDEPERYEDIAELDDAQLEALEDAAT